MSQLNDEARKGDELPSLQHHSLISVPKLSTSGYTTVFKPGEQGVDVYQEGDVEIVPRGEPLLRGWRDARGLWRIPLVDGTNEAGVERFQMSHEQMNSLYHLPSVEARVAYIHACLGFPTKSAMIDAAAAGRLVGVPFATVSNIHRFYPETKETPKGHLDQQRQGVRSTKVTTKTSGSLTSKAKEHDVFTQVWELRNTTYSDQTGRFPFTSYAGNKYVMVMVELDSSGIIVEGIKDRSSDELKRAYLKLLGRLKKAGVKPQKHIKDNEVSAELQDVIEEECQLELVPAGCHR
jgi:hypothetical protein